ncbi:hypothetical protein WJX73_009042 [Symbiochloris irregularis]|uniref:PCI domain-containing protein n=1 Tax=Symbiochloris irregularis TaxID=706552 RepID=A0AAW1NZZ7_9CHLO
MISQLVETSEEDSFLATARYIGDLLDEGQGRTALADTAGSQFTKESEALLAEGRYSELLTHFVGNFQLLFAKGQGKDIECCLNLLCHLLLRIDQDKVPAAAEGLAKGISAEVDSHAEIRLQALMQLHSLTPDTASRLQALLTALSYAQRAGLTSSVAITVKARLENWLKELAHRKVDERRLLLAAAELLRSTKKKGRPTHPRDAFRVTLRALNTFEGASSSEAAGVRDVAGLTLVDFARFQDIVQFDLADSPAVTQLKGDSQYGALYTLMGVLLAGDVQGLQSWLSSNAAQLESHSLSRDDLLTKARMCALLRLAHESSVITFSQVVEQLHVSEEEVEAWVVKAIGRGLLAARINQTTKQLTVTRAAHTQFQPSDWQTLRPKLALWQEHVKEIMSVVNSKQGVLGTVHG